MSASSFSAPRFRGLFVALLDAASASDSPPSASTMPGPLSSACGSMLGTACAAAAARPSSAAVAAPLSICSRRSTARRGSCCSATGASGAGLGAAPVWSSVVSERLARRVRVDRRVLHDRQSRRPRRLAL
eukprot:6370861-Prymnesium_polylepis.1